MNDKIEPEGFTNMEDMTFGDPVKAKLRRRLMIIKIVTTNFKSYYGE